VAAGESVIDPVVVGDLVRTHRGRRSGVDSLSPRELEVLGEIAQGKSNAAIAASLTLTERAVEKHANSIFGKLGLSAERDIKPPGYRRPALPRPALVSWHLPNTPGSTRAPVPGHGR